MDHPFPAHHPALRRCAHALLWLAVVEMAAIWLHPVAPTQTGTAWLQGLGAIRQEAMHLHLLLMACVIAIWLLLGALTTHWPSPLLARAADRLYAMGVAAMVAAPLINGFALVQFADIAASGDFVQADAAPAVALFAFELNQALSGFAIVVTSSAIALWSLALRTHPGALAAVTRHYGWFVAALCVGGYAVDVINTDVTGIAVVVVTQGLWYALVAATVLRWTAAAPSP